MVVDDGGGWQGGGGGGASENLITQWLKPGHIILQAKFISHKIRGFLHLAIASIIGIIGAGVVWGIGWDLKEYHLLVTVLTFALPFISLKILND